MILRKLVQRSKSKSLVITIPIEYCQKLKYKGGDYLKVTLEDNKVVLEKVK